MLIPLSILEILDRVDDEGALAEEIEQSDDFMGATYAAIIRAEKCSRGPPGTSPSGSSTDNDYARTSATVSTKSNRVRLPELTLHSFSGDVTQWLTFWDSFQSTIHNNSQLQAVDKFNYLKSLLTGTALEAIAGLTLSASNYDEAIAILQRSFGNRQQIIAKHMDQLLNVNPVTSANNLSGIRHLFDLVETHVRSLRSLGVSADSYGSLLSTVLLNKLPTDVCLLISRKIPEEEWSLDALLKELQQELQARERVVMDVKKPSNIGYG